MVSHRPQYYVLAFATTWNKKSIINNCEYATFIYCTSMRVSITNAWGITTYTNVMKWAYFTPWTENSKSSVDVTSVVNKYQDTYLIHATVHTHGAWVFGYDNNNFSPSDMKNAVARQLDNWLIAPNGNILRYDYIWDNVIKFSNYVTWHDPIAMGIFHSKCSLCVH